jgi:hypothetical protein
MGDIGLFEDAFSALADVGPLMSQSDRYECNSAVLQAL